MATYNKRYKRLHKISENIFSVLEKEDIDRDESYTALTFALAIMIAMEHPGRAKVLVKTTCDFLNSAIDNIRRGII